MKFSFSIRVFVIALVLRLIPILLLRGLGIGLDDMFQYDMLARSILSGKGYRWYAREDLKSLAQYVDFNLSTARGYDPEYGMRTSFRAPLYPTFLALVYFLSGTGFSRFFAARVGQALLLGAPLAPLTYLTAKQLSPFLFSNIPDAEKDRKMEWIAKTSAWIVAVYPMLLVYPLGLGTENLFFLLLLVSLLFLLKSIGMPSISNYFLSGVFLALTALTRSVILLFAGSAILFLIFLPALQRRFGEISDANKMGRIAGFLNLKAAIAGVVFLLIVLPWVVRNSLLHSRLTGIETSMGYNLYLGYHPQGDGSFIFGPSLDLLAIMDDAERDAIGARKAMGFLAEQPGRFIPLAVNRLGFFFGLEKRVVVYSYSNNLMGYISEPALLVIFLGLLFPFVFVSICALLSLPLLKWDLQTGLVSILFVSYLLPHVLILAEDRFHMALIPFFSILAARFLAAGFRPIYRRWNESGTGKWSVALATIGICLLLLNWGIELSRDADKISALFGPEGNKTHFSY